MLRPAGPEPVAAVAAAAAVAPGLTPPHSTATPALLLAVIPPGPCCCCCQRGGFAAGGRISCALPWILVGTAAAPVCPPRVGATAAATYGNGADGAGGPLALAPAPATCGACCCCWPSPALEAPAVFAEGLRLGAAAVPVGTRTPARLAAGRGSCVPVPACTQLGCCMVPRWVLAGCCMPAWPV